MIPPAPEFHSMNKISQLAPATAWAAALLLAGLAHAQDPTQRATQLLQKMTLDEKIGQLTQIGGLALVPDPLTPEQRVKNAQAGSILWLSDPASINHLQHIAVEQTRLHIPLLFGLDVIHGFKTVFPIPLAMAASWDPSLVERAQAVAARESRAAGINWTFAPMVDIARDPRWGRIIEGAGEDPYLGSAIAAAQVRGLQGKDLSGPDSVLACAKHFAGYGAADAGRDYESAYIPDDLLWNVYFPPFKAALDAGAATFMSAYMDLNDVPATGNRFLLTDVLRKAWGFQGFVVSDAFAVRDLVTHGFAGDPSDAAYRALTAGVNMDMASRTYLENLGSVVKSGKISESTIDKMVLPILVTKFRMGLFEHPYADESRMAGVLGAPEHLQLARVAAQRSAVLLRNQGQLLPLAKNAGKSIAVIGPLADAEFELLGAWQAMGVKSNAVGLPQGIRDVVPGARVEFAQGIEIRKTLPSMFDGIMGAPPTTPWSPERAADEFHKAVELARRSDIVILALGELALMSGELATQSTLDLPGKQQELMEAIAATGKPVVLVLVTGRPVDIRWAASHIPAILLVWHPGSEAGHAIADLLFGDANPGGKLPLTWPRHVGQVPIYYAHNLTHQPENQTKRYWNEESIPLFPFGYGLSYTSFSFSNLQVRQEEVTADVENTGDRAGDEVAQLYIHQQSGSASRPVRELKGFSRISLAPHGKKTVHFSLGPKELTYWSATMQKFVQDGTKFDIWVGDDSNAALHSTYEPPR
jgi:beta-glucosidase